MSFALAAVLVALVVAFFVARSRRQKQGASADASAELDGLVASVLESELAVKVLGLRAPSAEERKPLTKTLSGAAPDPDVVSKIEEQVKGVELEYIRFVHETDAELTVRIRYEDGSTSHVSKRVAWSLVPEGVRSDFERRASTHVFRSWAFPWQRASIA